MIIHLVVDYKFGYSNKVDIVDVKHFPGNYM